MSVIIDILSYILFLVLVNLPQVLTKVYKYV